MQTRRQFIGGVAAAGVLCLRGNALAQARPDYSIEIAPCTLQLSKKRTVKTVAYNGTAPGPLLRLHEGASAVVQVTNRSSNAEIVHWHGLLQSSLMDGAMEEGSPMIASGATLRYTVAGNPAGCRWYHTHTFAGTDMAKGQYTGQHGVLYVQPGNDPGSYDSEEFLVLEDWAGHMIGGGDGAMNPEYDVSTINGRVLGFGEPLRVKGSGRLLLHVVNASATEVHWIALAGHSFRVIALDGNPVPRPADVPMLRLSPAERVSAIVDLKHPGRWVLGEVRQHIQSAGMGIVLEYAGAAGETVWQQPGALVWDYAQFGAAGTSHDPVEEIPLVFESKFAGHGAMERWTINGKSYPDLASPGLVKGRRYRLVLQNRSLDDHPIHLHRHVFELASLPGLADTPRGILKDTVLVPANSQAAVDFIANNPGDTLLHCHQQDHMDRGFMMVFRYA